MPRLHPSAAALVAFGALAGLAGSMCPRAVWGTGSTTADLLGDGAVNGKVTAPAAELRSLAAVASARVYAYEIADLSLHRVLTDDRGEFSFASLPAGIYKIITHKSGFAPMVVLLSRASAAAQQYLEVQLQREPVTSAETGFWSLRDQVPPDVLREIEGDERLAVLTEDTRSALDNRVRTSVLAMRGVSDLPGTAAQRTSGSIGIETHLGEVSVGLSGRFSQIDPGGLTLQSGTAAGAAQTQALSVRVAGGQDQFNVTTLSSRQNTVDGARVLPVEFERYGVSWARPVGGSGHSQVTAQYTNESNFYKRGWVTPLAVPDFSQTLRVEGSYTDELSQNASLETGVRFRQRNGQYNNLRRSTLIDDTPDQSVDVFGRGTLRVLPTMLVEYGLYTTLRDGSVSLMPSGGVVLQLGSKWQAAGTLAQRVRRGPAANPAAFMPVMFGESGATEPAESYLYRVEFTRSGGSDGDSLKFGALDRKFDRSLRMYFSSDVFDHLENLFLVPGDRVPEIQASVSHRISQHVVGKLESSFGTGGGGIVVGTQRRTYSNQVRYLVTSVNARYEPTSTGVFIAFRRVEQNLAPSGANWIDPEATAIDSLELQLTQDLGSLFNLVGGWAFRLELGVDRGASPYILTASGDELRKRILAGVAVQF